MKFPTAYVSKKMSIQNPNLSATTTTTTTAIGFPENSTQSYPNIRWGTKLIFFWKSCMWGLENELESQLLSSPVVASTLRYSIDVGHNDESRYRIVRMFARAFLASIVSAAGIKADYVHFISPSGGRMFPWGI